MFKVQRHVNPKNASQYPTGLGAGMEWKADPIALVLYDYEAMEADELSMKEGERITIITKDNGGWWEAENSQKQRGWIPSNYVQEEGLSSPVAQFDTRDTTTARSIGGNGSGSKGRTAISEARALYDFEGVSSDELSFKEGEIVMIFKKEPEGWWEAENDKNKRGWIPANYVKEIVPK